MDQNEFVNLVGKSGKDAQEILLARGFTGKIPPIKLLCISFKISFIIGKNTHKKPSRVKLKLDF